MPAERVRVQRPARVDPLLWEHLPKPARLALASRFARTPEQAAAFKLESERLITVSLEQAVKNMTRAMEKAK